MCIYNNPPSVSNTYTAHAKDKKQGSHGKSSEIVLCTTSLPNDWVATSQARACKPADSVGRGGLGSGKDCTSPDEPRASVNASLRAVKSSQEPENGSRSLEKCPCRRENQFFNMAMEMDDGNQGRPSERPKQKLRKNENPKT